MFMGPFDQTAPWSMESIRGCGKFLDRVWNLYDMLEEGDTYSSKFEKMMHKAIKKVSNDIEEMKFNTAVSTFMTMVNEFYKLKKINKAEIIQTSNASNAPETTLQDNMSEATVLMSIRTGEINNNYIIVGVSAISSIILLTNSFIFSERL